MYSSTVCTYVLCVLMYPTSSLSYSCTLLLLCRTDVPCNEYRKEKQEYEPLRYFSHWDQWRPKVLNIQSLWIQWVTFFFNINSKWVKEYDCWCDTDDKMMMLLYFDNHILCYNKHYCNNYFFYYYYLYYYYFNHYNYYFFYYYFYNYYYCYLR